MMGVVVISGSCGLIGSECTRFFADEGFDVIGIDNDMRRVFFGEDASTLWNRQLLARLPQYQHYETDIRDADALDEIFKKFGKRIDLVIHTAAQPSHDWAAKDPSIDFGINAAGTLNLLETTRRHCPEAVFIFTSTNKVYGDTPNSLPLVELASRFELQDHPFAAHGIDETMSIDQTKHSLFGTSKLAADVIVQEYGRYFGMKTGVFRGGCLTGPSHSGTQLHGFLSFLVKCAVSREPYTIFGYKGKQVRDNIHSADLVQAFWHFFRSPKPGSVYNIGGGREANCSVLEAIEVCERVARAPMDIRYSDENRIGDHIWWISDIRRFRGDYPQWSIRYTIDDIVAEIAEAYHFRLKVSVGIP